MDGADPPVRSRGRRRRPPARWTLLGLLLGAVTLALLIQGFARHEIGRTSTAPPGNPLPGLSIAGPVADFSGRELRSVPVPPDRIALTFDDGPDPRWTPEILAVLRRHHVKATFFVVGAQVAAHPELLRSELRDGHEVGSHTFSHVDLGAVSDRWAALELSLTQSALAGAAGVNTPLLRLPYSSSAASLTAAQFRAAQTASRFGYLTVFATADGRDWERPGVDRVVANATPPPGRGAVVLLHDGGGDRAQTVAALDRLIPQLKAKGYRFSTISEVAGISHASVDPPVQAISRLQGAALHVVLRLAALVTGLLGALLLPIGILALLRGLAVLLLARRHVRTKRMPDGETFLPGVSVIVPAYNEEAGIEATVRSLVANRYPDLEVIVVDDGSTDATARIVASLDLPQVRLKRQSNAGKPAALNTGLRHARYDVIVMVDGDTVFESDTIRELVQPLADRRVGAVSGNTKVGNRHGLLGRWQHIEYVIGFNLDRRMYDVLRCMPTVPGAVGAFRRQALEAVGGVSGETLAEDTDLTMAINRAGWRVVYEERAQAWTEAPGTLGQLWRQRYRWCYGTMQAMWKHRAAVRERSPLGRLGLPYLLLFQVALPLLAPVIDLFAVYGLLFLDTRAVVAYWLAFNAFQVLLGAYAFRLDRERLGPLWAVPLQQFVYRQLMYLVVVQSVISAVLGRRLRWQKLIRTGLQLPAGDPGVTPATARRARG